MGALGLSQVAGSQQWQLNCRSLFSSTFSNFVLHTPALSSPKLARSILFVPTLYSRQLTFTLPLHCLTEYCKVALDHLLRKFVPSLHLHCIHKDSIVGHSDRHALVPPEPDKRRFNYGSGSNFPVKRPITRLLRPRPRSLWSETGGNDFNNISAAGRNM